MDDRGEHELGNCLTFGDGEGVGGGVVQDYFYFSTIIGIDGSDGSDNLFGG